MLKRQSDSLRRFLDRFRRADFLTACRRIFERTKLSTVMIIMGLCLLGYVGHEYWAMHREQQELHRQWIAQQSNPPVTSTGPVGTKDDGLTRVSIPKIDLDLIVVEGTNHKALRLGPGHMKNTPLPGDLGNSVISAHRDTFFRHIYELVKGDQIQVRRDGRTYTFEVMGKKIVQPDDVSVIRNTSDSRLTLITCYPTYYIGPAPERLIVTAKLVDDNQQNHQSAEKSNAVAAGQGS